MKRLPVVIAIAAVILLGWHRAEAYRYCVPVGGTEYCFEVPEDDDGE